MSARILRLRRWLARLALLGLLGAVLVLLLLGRDVRDEIQNLARASSANAQWSLSQPDMELLQLIQAAQSLRIGDGSTADLRRRYDIFYSRIRLMEVMPFYPEDLDLPEIRGGIEAARAFLSRTEALFDGTDAALTAAVPDILAAAEQLRPRLRDLTLRSLQQRTIRGDAQRETLRVTLVRLISSSAALLLAVMLVVLALVRMVRQAQLQNRQVRAAHARVRAIITASQDAILVLDAAGRIVDSNDAALVLFGLPAEALEGLPVSRFLGPEEGSSDAGPLPEPGARLVRVRGRRGTGEGFPAECSLTAIESDTGPLRICFLRDISDRLAAEAALVETRDRALAGEKAKDELLAVMSHEMRTPLNGILGTLDLIDDDLPAAQRRQYDRIIRSSAEQLLRHVNDVLEIARMDAFRTQLRCAPFDACALMRDIAHAQQGVAAREGNRLALDLRDDSLARVTGDGNRVHQVLLNLVSNALKFTRDGQITLKAFRNAEGDAVFEVRDSGIGIAPEDMSRIFEEFVTLNTDYNRKAQGTGLGLAISRRLATLMGGRLEAESAPGLGSVFRLILPLPPAEPHLPAPALPQDRYDVRPLSVLVVEDNPINRFVVRSMLAADGHSVTEAETGHEALGLCAQEGFDLILMDISMPGLDGVETTCRIREAEGPNATTPVVALTAHARPEDLRRFADSGIARSLTKPLRRQALRELLRDYGPRQTPTVTDDQPARVLIDDATVREMAGALGRDVYTSLKARFEAELTEGLRLLTSQPQRTGAEMAATAHKLAGAAAVFGLSALRAELVALEDLASTDEAGVPDTTLRNIGRLAAQSLQALAALEDEDEAA
ncbi:ATP-binding protein [Falsigemmobacter intermedius]|uniref:histidine kinase n=1 Tax=Falsigemmobacter intermedius TaxID=1553448 RepID=A0A3S4XU93_9RHOB|nr:ATP-binding protein [Falsigemmobacter intermedius]RWY42229.1 PAS domain-containing hybrid sensor histidine kinase/response regulator [Falsigemmobacter intermedius]